MKKFLSFSAAAVLLAGCANNQVHQQQMGYLSGTNRLEYAELGVPIYEPSGSPWNPNPNWDLNARGINQQPYGVGGVVWGAPGISVYTSSDAEKNIGPQFRPWTQVP